MLQCLITPQLHVSYNPSPTSILIIFLCAAIIYRFCFSVASDSLLNRVFILTENMTPEQRRENYSCDITYVTNSELGFDYLRDNLAMVCISYVGNTLLLVTPSIPNCKSFWLFYIHHV